MATTTGARRGAAKSRRPNWLRRRWQALGPRGRKLVVGGVAAVFLGFVALIGVVYAATDIPLPSELDDAQTTVVTYADGSPMLRLQGEQNRTDVPLGDVPEPARRAILAAEDRGYYHHNGISVRGIARAAYQDVFGSGPPQGGSTITQQYARNKFLSQQRTFARKFREAIIAVKLNRTYSKHQVFEWYLNTIYFGRGAYGIEAAAQTYFGVPASRLTVEQAALLAALIRSPEGGDPARNPEVAQRRWASVLDGMVKERWLRPDQRAAAKFPKVRPRTSAAQRSGLTGPNGYLSDMVLEELQANGVSSAEVYRSGLRVKTTIDKEDQEAARKAVETVLDDPARDPNAALVSLQPGTGRIVAMYGGRDFVKRQFNYAVDGRRQPGSTFKPVVLTAALEEGISLRTRFDGRSPQTFNGYEVENYGDEQFGQIDLIQATAHSVNTVYVPLGLRAGINPTLDAMHKLGVPDRVECQRDASLFLGSCEQRPIDMATVFATFAAQGERVRPYLVEQVVDRDGEEVYRAEPDKERVFGEDVMADATHAMRAVIDDGTATRARIGRPAAGKTGTTSDNIDAWFGGYVPQLATVVWMGYDPTPATAGKPAAPRPLVGVQGVGRVTGGTLPARIWHDFMVEAVRDLPVENFPPPAFVGRAPTVSSSPTSSPSPSPSPSVSLTPSEVPTSQPPSEEPTTLPPVSPSESPSESSEPSPSDSPTETEPSPPEPSP